MDETNETIVDIIAEMRFHGQQNIDAEKDKPEYGVLIVEGRIARNYADRLEAAWKRENGAIAKIAERMRTYDTSSEGEALRQFSYDIIKVLEREPTAEKSSVVGDAAKMREALSDACYAMFNFLKTQYGGYEEMANALDKAKAALAEPVRNYEVGTVEEQYARYEDFCCKHYKPSSDTCLQCPFSQPTCKFAWAQMPYEKEA